jgi:hypothetical protein
VTHADATVGMLLASRRGGARDGAIVGAGGAVFAAGAFGNVIGGTFVLRDAFDPVANVLFLVGPASVVPGYALILPVLALTFPDGRLPSPRWRWPAGVALGALAAATTLVVLRPGEIAATPSRNPLGIDALPAWLSSLADPLYGIGIVLISVLGVAAVVTRYRRGSGLERHQIRWFAAAVLLAVAPMNLAALPGTGGPGWFVLAAFGLLLVPVSVGIAVTRYRLYEIDRLISRGASWAVLSGLLLAVYAGAVLLLQGVLGSVTQGETVAVAGSTLLAAALFQPLRRRVQHTVDRRFDRARYDGERIVAAFAARLRDQVEIEGLEADVGEVVRLTVAPSSLGLWVRRSGADW